MGVNFNHHFLLVGRFQTTNSCCLETAQRTHRIVSTRSAEMQGSAASKVLSWKRNPLCSSSPVSGSCQSISWWCAPVKVSSFGPDFFLGCIMFGCKISCNGTSSSLNSLAITGCSGSGVDGRDGWQPRKHTTDPKVGIPWYEIVVNPTGIWLM